MIKPKKKDPNSKFVDNGHGRPVTRRDFLSCGLISTASMVTAPTLAQWLFMNSEAFAQGGCETPVNTNFPAYIEIELNGGVGMCGNVVPHDIGDNPITNVDRTGLISPAAMVPLNSQFGIDYSASLSQILVGFLANCSAGTQANIQEIAISTQTRDDTNDLDMALAPGINSLGLTGIDISSAVGTVNTIAGSRKRPVFAKTNRATYLSSDDALRGAIAVGGRPAGFLSPASIEKITRGIHRLSDTQRGNFLSMHLGDQLQQLSNCGLLKNVANAQKAPIDLATSPIAGVWDLNDQRERHFGTLVLAALTGKVGPVSLVMGGYDYHDGTQTTGDQRDLEYGQIKGKICESAALLSKKLFIRTFSDGSTYSDRDTRIWRGDDASKSMCILTHYDPAGVSALGKNYLGHFTSGQGAAKNVAPGKSPELGSLTALYAYLTIAGQTQLFDQVLREMNITLTTQERTEMDIMQA